MPAQRKQTVIGRAPGRDRAGATLAEYERIEYWCRRAEKAGLDIGLWYREGIEKLMALAARPITRTDIDEMEEVEDAMRLGLSEAGIEDCYQGKPLVPQKYRLYDLQWREREQRYRMNELVEWAGP